MREIKEQRELVQKRVDGKVFRFVKRFYEIGPKIIGTLRVLDGPQQSQGFYAVDERNQRVHLPKVKSWKQLENVLLLASQGNNGGH